MAVIRGYSPSDSSRSDRSASDRLRHRQKVKESMQKDIGSIIADESIIGKRGDKIIKVPIRGVKEYRFIYGDNRGAAQGEGNERSGDVVGHIQDEGRPGKDKAGDQPGVDYYETDVTLDEILEMMFADLHLPDMKEKPLRYLLSERDVKHKGYRKVGIRVRLDKKKTVRELMRRRVASGFKNFAEEFKPQVSEEEYNELLSKHIDDPIKLYQIESWYYTMADKPGFRELRFPLDDEDLKYRHMEPEIREESNAAVLCIMDTSGSMDTTKKYLARSFFLLLYNFVTTKYRNVKIVFIAHHTEGKEVTEEEFFHKVEFGGTFISSGYIKALEIIKERYHPDLWNIYAFHCSDGDNFESDNSVALKNAQELCDISNLFGYGEIKPTSAYSSWESSMIKVFNKITASNFAIVRMRSKDDVWPAFEGLLKKERVKEE